MSGPVPKTDDSRCESGRRDHSQWYVLSLFLHGAAVLALMFLTPVRHMLWQEALSNRQPTRPRMSTEQIREVGEQLDEMTEQQIENNVDSLHGLIEQMQAVNAAQFKEYVVFEHSQIERAPETVKDSLEQALEAMSQAQDLIQADDHAEAATRQALAISHQEAIAQRLDLVQSSQEVCQLQAKAMETQARAEQQAVQADAAVRTIEEIDHKLKSPAGTMPVLEERVPQQEDALENALDKIRTGESSLQSARDQLESAKESQDSRAVERSAKKVALQEKALERANRLAETKRGELAKTRQRLAEYGAQVAELQAEKERQQLIEKTAHETAEQLQSAAIDQQLAVSTQILAEVARRVEELQAELDPNETVQEELTVDLEKPATQSMNALELYESALAAEAMLAEKYRQGRAMRLAVIQDVPFSGALDAVDRVTPVRPDLLNEPLTAEVADEKQLEAKKEAIRAALAETNAMVALGNSLVSQAIKNQRVGGLGSGVGPISLASIQARSLQSQQLASLADQETSGRAVDLAGAMASSPEAGEAANPQSADSSPRDFKSDDAPPLVNSSIKPVPGRSVADSGDGAEWMAITQWYMLGPFANPGRANIDRVFPPETLIDLNAVYLGKDDRPIRWKYTHSEHPLGRLQPTNDEPYGIWYAFAEVKFNRARDLWITMGSDDKGRVWINDQLVWVSESYHKNWGPAEAQRRVHFREGRNKVLFRIENGWHGMAFSLWIHLTGD